MDPNSREVLRNSTAIQRIATGSGRITLFNREVEPRIEQGGSSDLLPLFIIKAAQTLSQIEVEFITKFSARCTQSGANNEIRASRFQESRLLNQVKAKKEENNLPFLKATVP
jgi:hypothetical protein